VRFGRRRGQSTQKEIKGAQRADVVRLLLGEIAQQRGDYALAAKTYLDLARRTRDPRVARRAVEVASKANQPELAIQAARTWYDIEPDSPQAPTQVLAAMLVAARRGGRCENPISRNSCPRAAWRPTTASCS
jgi:hypothetical protein